MFTYMEIVVDGRRDDGASADATPRRRDRDGGMQACSHTCRQLGVECWGVLTGWWAVRKWYGRIARTFTQE